MASTPGHLIDGSTAFDIGGCGPVILTHDQSAQTISPWERVSGAISKRRGPSGGREASRDDSRSWVRQDTPPYTVIRWSAKRGQRLAALTSGPSIPVPFEGWTPLAEIVHGIGSSIGSRICSGIGVGIPLRGDPLRILSSTPRGSPFLVTSSPRRSEKDYFHQRGRCGPLVVPISHARNRATGPATLPSLTEVQQDPSILTGLPLPVILDLRRQVGHLAADVDAALYQTLTEARTTDHRSVPEPDRLLTPAAAAARFGVTKRWLVSHADDIPGVRRLSRKIVRFSERRLAQFLEGRPV